VKLLSPLYFAVTECEPTDKLDKESWAALLETAAVPKDVVPSRNVTVPVALPPKAAWIAADKVTVWPKADGFALEATEVVVAAPFTT
jgi:hypothetical protein